MRRVLLVLCALLCVACQTSQPTPGTTTVPAWANFMKADEYRSFLSKVEAHFTSQNRQIQVEDGLLSFPQEPGSAKFGLLNLAQACHQEYPSEWKNLIEQHFIIIEQVPHSDTPLSFEEAQKSILIRVVPPEYAKASADSLHREDIPGTLSMLVIDSPQSVRSVSQEEVREWGVSKEQLFDLGLKNLESLSFSKPEQIELQDGVSLTAVADDSFFTASLALKLQDHPEWLGEHGSLVGIPTRHMLLVYPIKNKDVLSVIQLLPELLSNLEKEGPGSVTSAMYYYDGQSLELVPYASTEGSITISPPKKLSEAFVKVSKRAE